MVLTSAVVGLLCSWGLKWRSFPTKGTATSRLQGRSFLELGSCSMPYTLGAGRKPCCGPDFHTCPWRGPTGALLRGRVCRVRSGRAAPGVFRRGWPIFGCALRCAFALPCFSLLEVMLHSFSGRLLIFDGLFFHVLWSPLDLFANVSSSSITV